MANLIGYLDYGHHAGRVHRLGHKYIRSNLATWEGNIVTDVSKDGSATVFVNDKLVWTGNINEKAQEKLKGVV